MSGIGFCLQSFLFYLRASDSLNAFSGRKEEEMNVESLLSDGAFARYYVYFRYLKGKDVSALLPYVPPTCESYCLHGDICKAQGKIREAENYYQSASFMIPARLAPLYKLWRLYVEEKDSAKARCAAECLLTRPLKVENTFTVKAKAEARCFLDK